MTNQTNASGSVSIDGNVDANEFVGRDKNDNQSTITLVPHSTRSLQPTFLKHQIVPNLRQFPNDGIIAKSVVTRQT